MQNPHTKQFVAYYRVSTQMQGRSGLGLEAQRDAVARYLRSINGELIGEFTEVESGRKDSRPELENALRFAEKMNVTLLIAKLDRLARSVAFITKLMDGKVPFVSVDMPDANRMMLQISAVFAEHEARMISERTKVAIASKRARGDKWGTNDASAQRASDFAKSLHETIKTLNDNGITKPQAIANALNERGITTPKGAQWGAGQVVRLLKKLQ